MSEAATARGNPLREALLVWAGAFLLVVVTYVIYRPGAKLVATAAFLYLPLHFMRRRGEDYRDLGVTFRNWREDVKWFLLVFLPLVPIYAFGFWGYAKAMELLPPELVRHLWPYPLPVRFEPALPDQLLERVVDNLLVVALPEEFFYRGYLWSRLNEALPRGKTVFGVKLGPAFWLVAALFAIGHLAVFQFWRLGVFFPALLFGWVRGRTGTVLGATLLHAACNLLEVFLRASFIR